MKAKRTLPVNVDGRLKVGPFPIKNFFKWLPFPVFFLVLFFSDPGQNTLIIGILGIGLSAIPFMEFRFKQSGWDFLKEIIQYDLKALLADFFPKYFKHKQVRFERSVVDDSLLQRFTFNQKTYRLNRKQNK